MAEVVADAAEGLDFGHGRASGSRADSSAQLNKTGSENCSRSLCVLSNPNRCVVHIDLVPVVLRLVRAVDRDAEVLGLLRRQLGQLHAELVEVQPGDFFVELLGQHVDAERDTCPVSVHRASWASTWLVNELDITNDGWPVAQPRFTSRPSASRRIEWPSGNVYLSTAPTVVGLMFMLA